MNLGPLDRRCRIEYPDATQDAIYGAATPVWVLLAVAWCNVQDVLPSRSESVKQGLALAAQQVRVRMRYRTDVTSAMRLIILRPEPQYYQIIAGPAELGNKDGIEIMAERYSS